jgi:hypothetical protein
MHIVIFMDSLSGLEISSDEDEPSMRPENPDDIESNPMQPPMIGQLPVMLPQQPAPAAAPFDFGSFMRETGGNTTAFGPVVFPNGWEYHRTRSICKSSPLWVKGVNIFIIFCIFYIFYL